MISGAQMPNTRSARPSIIKLLLIGLILGSCAIVHAEQLLTDAVVLVSCSAPNETSVGNGFVIGDGSMIVTAAHLLFSHEPRGEHSARGLCTVISPYLGDAADAEVSAFDLELDLAILKVNWTAHPSVDLADADQIPSAGPVNIVRVNPTPTSNPAVEQYDGRIDYLAISDGKRLFLALRVDDDVEQGWSGAPILLPGKHSAIGCLVATRLVAHAGRANEKQTIAMTLADLGRLVAVPSPSTRPAQSAETQPADAATAFALFAKLLSNPPSSPEWPEKLLQLRPNSAVAVRIAARAHERAGDASEAERLYRRAVELRPTPQSCLYCAQFLIGQQKEAQAEEFLKRAWEIGTDPSPVASLWAPLLMHQHQAEKAVAVLEAALKADPNNGYLWFMLGQVRDSEHQRKDAVKDYSAAARLLPGTPPFEIALAQALRADGSLDEAQRHYQIAVDAEPRNPVYHFALAEFLAERGPTYRSLALDRAKAALSLPESIGLPKVKIERLIARLEGRTPATTRASEPAAFHL